MKVRVRIPLFWTDPEPEPLAFRLCVVPTAEAVFVHQAVEFSEGFITLLFSKIIPIEYECDSASVASHPIYVSFIYVFSVQVVVLLNVIFFLSVEVVAFIL